MKTPNQAWPEQGVETSGVLKGADRLQQAADTTVGIPGQVRQQSLTWEGHTSQRRKHEQRFQSQQRAC